MEDKIEKKKFIWEIFFESHKRVDDKFQLC